MRFKELWALLEKNRFEAKVYVPEKVKDDNPDIRLLVSDSRLAEPGTIFACVS